MNTDEIDNMFVTPEDLTPESIKQDMRLKGFRKAQYRVAAWLNSERLKWLVYEIETPGMLDITFKQAVNSIQARLLVWINRNVSGKRLKRRYVEDLQQAIGGALEQI